MTLPPWTPDLATLDLLLSVAETGSVGRAAAAHAVSQPSASARLSRLERRLGVALLVRTRRGTTLTPAGETVAEWARSVVDAARRLTDGVAALRQDRQARLRVAASLTVAEYLLPGWLLTLDRRHAGTLDIAARVANSRDVCDLVRTGAVELGFVEMPDVPEDLSRRAVGDDRLAVVAAPSYPLAARAGSGVTPADVAGHPVLLREEGSGTREVFLRALGEVRLARATALGSTATIMATARAGGGIGVVSARAVRRDLDAGELVELHVRGVTLNRTLHAVWAGGQLPPLARELVAVATA